MDEKEKQMIEKYKKHLERLRLNAKRYYEMNAEIVKEKARKKHEENKQNPEYVEMKRARASAYYKKKKLLNETTIAE